METHSRHLLRGLLICSLVLTVQCGSSSAADVATSKPLSCSIHLHSYKSRQKAEKLLADLPNLLPKNIHGSARIEAISSLYAVRVGGFPSRAAANEALKSIKPIYPAAMVLCKKESEPVERTEEMDTTGATKSVEEAPVPMLAAELDNNAKESGAASEQEGVLREQVPPLFGKPAANGNAAHRDPFLQAFPGPAEAFPTTVETQSATGQREHPKVEKADRGFLEVMSAEFKDPYVSVAIGLIIALALICFAIRRGRGRFTQGASNSVADDAELGDVPALSRLGEHRVMENMRELSLVEGNILSFNNNLRAIYVTSCLHSEGKTTAAIQIAHALSMSGSSLVLLVDANPRNPAIHREYSTRNKTGFTDFLFSNASLDSVVMDTRYRQLKIMTFGSMECGHLNISKDHLLKDKLAVLKEGFDFIIFDGDSLRGSSDAAIITRYFDGTVIVVECEKTKWELVQQASEKISLLGGKVLGLVLNKRKYYIPRFLYGKV